MMQSGWGNVSNPSETMTDETEALQFTVTLSQTKQTKGTVRYDSADENPLIKTVYISKAAFDGEPPEEIDLTVDDDVSEEEEDLDEDLDEEVDELDEDEEEDEDEEAA